MCDVEKFGVFLIVLPDGEKPCLLIAINRTSSYLLMRIGLYICRFIVIYNRDYYYYSTMLQCTGVLRLEMGTE